MLQQRAASWYNELQRCRPDRASPTLHCLLMERSLFSQPTGPNLQTRYRNSWTSPLLRGNALFAHVTDRELKDSRKRMMDRAAFDARLLCFPAPSTTCREDYLALLTYLNPFSPFY